MPFSGLRFQPPPFSAGRFRYIMPTSHLGQSLDTICRRPAAAARLNMVACRATCRQSVTTRRTSRQTSRSGAVARHDRRTSRTRRRSRRRSNHRGCHRVVTWSSRGCHRRRHEASLAVMAHRHASSAWAASEATDCSAKRAQRRAPVGGLAQFRAVGRFTRVAH